MMNHLLRFCLVAILAAIAPSLGHGAFVDTIAIDGDTSDWAGISPVDVDPADNVGSIDLQNTYVVNNDDFLFIRNTFFSNTGGSVFLALDTDSDTGTGFDVFGSGLVGSEVGFQNDFPFVQSAGVFNTGESLSGDFFGTGGALLATVPGGLDRELAISLDSVYEATGNPVLPSDTFRLLIYSDSGSGDVSAAINYTVATAVPEPTSVAALLAVGLAAGMRRQFRSRKHPSQKPSIDKRSDCCT